MSATTATLTCLMVLALALIVAEWLARQSSHNGED